MITNNKIKINNFSFDFFQLFFFHFTKFKTALFK